MEEGKRGIEISQEWGADNQCHQAFFSIPLNIHPYLWNPALFSFHCSSSHPPIHSPSTTFLVVAPSSIHLENGLGIEESVFNCID